MENTSCAKCGSPSKYKEGIKKETGKPWNGYFCQNPMCKNVSWGKPGAAPQPKPTTQPQNSHTSDAKPMNAELMVIERLDAIEKGLEDLTNFIKSKLG